MAESIVNDWLSDYSLLEQSEIRTFAAQHEHNHEVASAIFTVLNERQKFPDLLHSICNQFFNFYRSNEPNLRHFTLQFFPTLIFIYLNSVAQGDKRSCRSIETLLLSIYNIEVIGEDGQPKTISFRMPVIAQPSIYHEEKNLNPTDLRRWEENSNKEVTWGPLQPAESVNAQNRLKIMTALVFCYNQQLSLIQKASLSHLCRSVSLLMQQGFSKLGHAHRISYGSDPTNAIVSKPVPRIPVSSQLLLEFSHSIYFAMFNDFGSIAIQTIDDIHNRATYELYPDVILLTNAIKNSLHTNTSGQPIDGPMGLSVASTPSTSTTTVSKSMITNASFRTKKLPDDIPIQGPNKDDSSSGSGGGTGTGGGSGGGQPLVSISEEFESESNNIGNRNAAGRSSKEGLKITKVPFAGFKKSKDKDKEKEKDKEMKHSSTIIITTASNAIGGGNVTKNGPTYELASSASSIGNSKETVSVQRNRKERFSISNRGSIPSATDYIDGSDTKVSPTSAPKRKTSYNDGSQTSQTITTESYNTAIEFSPSLAAFANGISTDMKTDGGIGNGNNKNVSDETIIINNGVDNGAGGGVNNNSNPELISIGTHRTSINVDLKSNSNNMQISQV